MEELAALSDASEDVEFIILDYLATFDADAAEEWLGALAQEGGVLDQVVGLYGQAEGGE